MAQPTAFAIPVPSEDPKKKKDQKPEDEKAKVNGDAAEGEELVSTFDRAV